MKRVAVAMSGGVDSLVAAILLKRSGLSLVGVYMRNWDQRDEGGQCTADTDYNHVNELCTALNIPCTSVEFVKEYWNEVFSDFIQSYQRGHTPNPDILCNRCIKFNALHHFCKEILQVDTIATGHYARVVKDRESNKMKLKMGVDFFKDQTYFLSQIEQSALAQSMFPVGSLKKEEVRKIATEAGFKHVTQLKESMGLCFIGKRDFQSFLSQYVEEKRGKFVSLSGSDLGWHNGQHLFTIGQRARIGGQPHPLFVAGKDPATNTVTVVEGTDHPALYTSSFTTSHPHWISNSPLLTKGVPFKCKLRYYHQAPLVPCSIEVCRDSMVVEMKQEKRVENSLQVTTSDVPLRAVARGQYAVFYDGDVCLGGACIMATGPSLWQQNFK